MIMIKCIDHRRFLRALLCLGVIANSAPVLADAGADPTAGASASPQAGMSAQSTGISPVPDKNVYMLVNGKPITFWEYNSELVSLLKNRYYHGKVPEGKEKEVQKELTDTLVERILLVEDAERRGLKPDEAAIERVIASAEARGKLEGAARERLLREIRDVEGKRSLINQLDKVVRDVPQPTPAEVQAYFDQHLDLFTEPEKLRLSVILLKVDPSSPVDAWAKAFEDAREIRDQIKGGADFAELARKRSGDKSADKGGDLGYLHRGMLPKGLDDKVDKFQAGVVTDPIKMLEGFSVFRLEDRIPPNKMEFEQVKQRAEALLIRDRQEQAVKGNIDRLRSTAKIEVVSQPAGEGGAP